MTSIYGLCDPRNDVVMYVGKGPQKRAQSHWKRFLSVGKSQNLRQHRWFEKLKAEGVEPTWLFLEENVENWEERERYWIAYWRERNSELCNISNGGNEPFLPPDKLSEIRREAGKLSGPGLRQAYKLHPELREKARKNLAKQSLEDKIKGGRIGGRRSIEIHGTPQTFEGSSKGGKATGRKNILKTSLETRKRLGSQVGSRYGSIGGKEGGPLANHNRWHVKRNLFNPDCKHCREEVSTVAYG